MRSGGVCLLSRYRPRVAYERHGKLQLVIIDLLRTWNVVSRAVRIFRVRVGGAQGKGGLGGKLASGPGRFLRGRKNGLLVQSVWLSPEKWGYRISPDSTCILNRILPVTWLHIHVFYPCTLVYTCNSNLVPNTSAVYFISTYTNDFILRSFSRMREQIAPGRYSSPKNGLGSRLGENTYGGLCVSAGMLAAPIRLQRA